MSSTAAEHGPAESFRGKYVLVTGASGFLGGRLVARLRGHGARVVGVSSGRRRSEFPAYDLASPKQAEQLFRDYRFDYAFHCAGDNGGIGVNTAERARLFASNTLLALNVVSNAALSGVKRLVGVVASCAYPASERWEYDNAGYQDRPREVCGEKEFFEGPPHPSVEGHAYAKRNLQLACAYYSRPDFRAVTVCPATLYGEGQSYEPEKTKVVAAMVKRFCDAADQNLPSVTCWGSGRPLREVLHADDCAELVLRTFFGHDDPSAPLNLGTGQEFSVRDIAGECAAAAGYRGEILWDESRGDGQFRKRLDCGRLRALAPDFAPLPFREGLARAVLDYRARRAS